MAAALRYLNDNNEWIRNIYPSVDDKEELLKIDIQRQQWKEFLSSSDVSLDNIEIWQYYKDENRPSKVTKGLLSMFSSRIKQQKRVKKLIRNGIPPELRGRIWWTCR
jgi:hypothetical protein